MKNLAPIIPKRHTGRAKRKDIWQKTFLIEKDGGQGGDRRSEGKKWWTVTGTKRWPNYKDQGNIRGWGYRPVPVAHLIRGMP